MTAPLSPREAAIVARFDEAEAAPESLRERVAWAIASENIGVTLTTEDEWDFYLRSDEQEDFRRLAGAAIRVITEAVR